MLYHSKLLLRMILRIILQTAVTKHITNEYIQVPGKIYGSILYDLIARVDIHRIPTEIASKQGICPCTGGCRILLYEYRSRGGGRVKRNADYYAVQQ